MIEIKGKIVLISICLALALSLLTASVQAITWGEPTGEEYSNVCMVIGTAEEHIPVCTGTLISPTVILTAGHCTGALEQALAHGLISEINVSFDPEDPLNPAKFHLVSEVHTHPGFNPNTKAYDVGVLILEESANIEPATLAEEGLLDELSILCPDFSVVGYGDILSWPPPIIITNVQRRYATSGFQALLKTQLLLSQNNKLDQGGSCWRDSGGSVFWKEDDTRILVAIISWGDPLCVSMGFNYRVDIAETLNFIEAHL